MPVKLSGGSIRTASLLAELKPGPLQTRRADAAIGSSLSPRTPVDDIKKFLRAFEPSLHSLTKSFLREGIVDHHCLNALCTWPRESLVDYFSNYFRGGGTKKATVEALVTRFTDKSCHCGLCPHLVEPECRDYVVEIE
ncbi:hypothetical protein B0H12DRAFT_1238851 [Mycena haematopus]|nr:hypothetical protein B0H12DRAFT_1238851 [Mycena haematopus]